MHEPVHQTDADISRIIEMAWEDRTPFEAIRASYNVSEAQVIVIMRQSLKARSFKVWRERVAGRKTKHAALCEPGITRHRANHRRPQA